MHRAAEAYGAVAKSSVSPRELEASLLVKAAAKLQAAQNGHPASGSALDEALAYNRRLWSVFASAVADPQNPLPQDIRNNIASLSMFIFRHTLEAQSRTSPEKLAVLIKINREVAAGLRSIETAATAALPA